MRHPVGSIEDFPSGTVQVREVGRLSIGVVNSEGELYAVLNVCPHAKAPVCEGSLTGTMLPSAPGEAIWGRKGLILRCPWHGYEFDLGDGGRGVFTSFKARLRMFPVSVEDGTVYVETRSRAGVAAGRGASRSA